MGEKGGRNEECLYRCILSGRTFVKLVFAAHRSSVLRALFTRKVNARAFRFSSTCAHSRSQCTRYASGFATCVGMYLRSVLDTMC